MSRPERAATTTEEGKGEGMRMDNDEASEEFDVPQEFIDEAARRGMSPEDLLSWCMGLDGQESFKAEKSEPHPEDPGGLLDLEVEAAARGINPAVLALYLSRQKQRIEDEARQIHDDWDQRSEGQRRLYRAEAMLARLALDHPRLER